MPGTSKTVLVQFVGGFQDGRRLNSRSSDPAEAQEALGQYFMSSEGTVGKRFRTVSEAGWREMQEIIEVTPDGPRLKREPIYGMDHVYELVERIEDDTTIALRFEYQGKSMPDDAG